MKHSGREKSPKPLGTVTTKARFAVAEPFITEYYGTQKDIAHSVEEPLNTITTKDRFALVMPEVNGKRLDIRFRMLKDGEWLTVDTRLVDPAKYGPNYGHPVKPDVAKDAIKKPAS